jgi:hypothetical protein
VAIILCILVILYFVGTSPQGEPSKWFGGGFIFQGQPPSSTPPSAEINTKPVVAPDSPRYLAEQVAAIASDQSPDCRAPTKRVGWAGRNCPQYEDAEPIFKAEYLGKGIWSVAKTCPINSKYNGSWYFYEDSGKLLERD